LRKKGRKGEPTERKKRGLKRLERTGEKKEGKVSNKGRQAVHKRIAAGSHLNVRRGKKKSRESKRKR